MDLANAGNDPSGSVPFAQRFSVLTPPGWEQLPLEGASGAWIDDLADAVLAGRPRDSVAGLRRSLKQSLSALAAQAAELDLISAFVALPQGDPPALIPATIVFARLPIPEGSDPIDLLVQLAMNDATATHVELDASVALRTVKDQSLRPESVVPDGTDLPDDVAAELATVRQAGIRYVVGVPGDKERWLVAELSVTVPAGPDGDVLITAFGELLDAVMRTLRWK